MNSTTTTGPNSQAGSKTATEEEDFPYLMREVLDTQETYRRACRAIEEAREALKKALQKKYGYKPNDADQTKRIVCEDPGPRVRDAPKAYWIITYSTETGTFDLTRSD